MTEQASVQVTVAIQDPDLDDEELQAAVEHLLPQVREVDGVESADLVAVEDIPKDSKAFGGFLSGMLTAEVNSANIKKLLVFLGDRLGGKQIEMALKTPDGRELNLKASSQAEFEFAFQKAQEFLKS
jgi:hypothetical protein